MSYDPNQSQPLNVVVVEYLQAVEAGKSPDRDARIAAHPDLADDLRPFFACHDQMHGALNVSEDATMALRPVATEDATVPPHLRRTR